MIQPLDLLRWQGRKRGLLDIGYHLIIARTGDLHLVRAIDTIGSHTPGYNHISVGVCLIGGLPAPGAVADEAPGTFTPEQIWALVRIAAAFKAEHPHGKVLGHKECHGYQETSTCPVLNMDDIRAGVEALAVPLTKPKTLTQITARGYKPTPMLQEAS